MMGSGELKMSASIRRRGRERAKGGGKVKQVTPKRGKKRKVNSGNAVQGRGTRLAQQAKKTQINKGKGL